MLNFNIFVVVKLMSLWNARRLFGVKTKQNLLNMNTQKKKKITYIIYTEREQNTLDKLKLYLWGVNNIESGQNSTSGKYQSRIF